MDAELQKSWDVYTNRYLAEGVPLPDIQQIRGSISSWDGWCAGWYAFAQQAEQRALAALEKNYLLTAGTEYARASVYACFGHYLFWHNITEKKVVHDYSCQMMQKAAPLLSPPLQPVRIPFNGIEMSAYLRLPNEQQSDYPCVICLGGLDSGKEEWLVMSGHLAQRGVASLLFDGPGQGETFYDLKMSSHFTQSISTVIDFLEKRPEINSNRIGLVGRSLGGYYGPRAAALDHRIKALAVWGAFFDLQHYAQIPQHTLDGFIFVCGSKTLEEALPYIHSIDLSDVVQDIVCPTYILHGGKDVITPLSHAQRLEQGISSKIIETAIWPNSGHCNHDVAHIARPAMADFLHKHLQ
jgi:2,6-dihydroxypseudooxynicotine hydrolase